MSEAEFRATLDPVAIINNRASAGGPQPAEMQRMLKAAKQRLAQQNDWVAQSRGRISSALAGLDRDFDKLLATSKIELPADKSRGRLLRLGTPTATACGRPGYPSIRLLRSLLRANGCNAERKIFGNGNGPRTAAASAKLSLPAPGKQRSPAMQQAIEPTRCSPMCASAQPYCPALQQDHGFCRKGRKRGQAAEETGDGKQPPLDRQARNSARRRRRRCRPGNRRTGWRPAYRKAASHGRR